MKKSFKLENLDCANCAAKMETAINKLGAVKEATISFMTQRLTIEADCADEATFDAIVKDAQKAIKKVERGCKILV